MLAALLQRNTHPVFLADTELKHQGSCTTFFRGWVFVAGCFPRVKNRTSSGKTKVAVARRCLGSSETNIRHRRARHSIRDLSQTITQRHPDSPQHHDPMSHSKQACPQLPLSKIPASPEFCGRASQLSSGWNGLPKPSCTHWSRALLIDGEGTSSKPINFHCAQAYGRRRYRGLAKFAGNPGRPDARADLTERKAKPFVRFGSGLSVDRVPRCRPGNPLPAQIP